MGGKKPLFWVVMTVIAEMVLIAVLVPYSFLAKIQDIEFQWMQATYSEQSFQWLHDETDDWHYLLTRKTGLAEGMRWMFFPSEEAQAKEKGMSRLGKNLWFPYLESRGKALDDMAKTLLMRLGSILLWAPLLVLIMIPAFFDGFMERKIKQHTFKYTSPFVYRYSVRSVMFVSFLFSACLLSPVPVPHLILPLSLIAIILVLGISVIGNMPKRL